MAAGPRTLSFDNLDRGGACCQDLSMRCLRSLSAVSLCLLAPISLGAADAALPGFLPPGARVLFGLRVRSLIDALAAQGIGKEAQGTLSGLLAQTPLVGFDPFHDVDEILLASTGEGQNPSTLMVMTGRFNAAAFSSEGTRFGNAFIVESGQGAKQVTALVDANTVLMGDPLMVLAALDRGDKGGSTDPGLAAQAAEFHARYDIWGVGNPPPGVKLPAAGAEPLQSVDRFAFGMTLAHGLELTADLHVRSPKDIEKLSASLQFIETMLKAQTAGANEGRLDLRTENATIHVSLSIPEEALKKAVAAQRASLASARPGAPAPAPKPAPPAKTEIVQDSSGATVTVKLPGRR